MWGDKEDKEEFIPMPNAQCPIPNPRSLLPDPQSPIPNPRSPIPNPRSHCYDNNIYLSYQT
ncbi:hypothetical protein BLD44_015160 [Mastigocladus laminosus UU774]|nr:hypothetical protein BLD44_015160 [Mastigocladus laminosus UU774]